MFALVEILVMGLREVYIGLTKETCVMLC